MRQIIDRLAYLVVRIFVCILQATSLETCESICDGLAFLAADVLRIRGRVVDDNLRGAFPDWTAAQRRRVTRDMWRHLLLMVCEIAHTPRKIHQTNWRRYVNVEDRREIVGALLAPRPTVIVSGHFGNFELGSYLCALLGFPTFAIARRLDNPFLHDYVNRFRSRTGQYILPKDGSAKQVEKVLGSNGTLLLLGDQHAGPKGCWIDFLGRPASCHKALALFSLSSGGPMLVLRAQRAGRPMRFEIGLEGIADPQLGTPETANVKSLTAWYNRKLEEIIRRAPDQYWWLHRRWRDAPARVVRAVEDRESRAEKRSAAA